MKSHGGPLRKGCFENVHKIHKQTWYEVLFPKNEFISGVSLRCWKIFRNSYSKRLLAASFVYYLNRSQIKVFSILIEPPNSETELHGNIAK